MLPVSAQKTLAAEAGTDISDNSVEITEEVVSNSEESLYEPLKQAEDNGEIPIAEEDSSLSQEGSEEVPLDDILTTDADAEGDSEAMAAASADTGQRVFDAEVSMPDEITSAETADEPEAEAADGLQVSLQDNTVSVKTGYVDAEGLNVRSGAGTGYTVLGTVSYAKVVIKGTAKDSSGKTWYKIAYGSRTGYVHGSYVTDIKTVNVSLDQLSAFPTEYQELLAGILAIYPNFTFEPEDIDYTLEEAADWHTGVKVEADGNGWWTPSSYETILAYMDPTYYMTSQYIFAFAEQYYNSSQTKAGLKKMLTALDCFLNTDDYISALLEAGQKYNVNPYVLAATITIEKGSHADTNGNADVTGREVWSGSISGDNIEVYAGAGYGYDLKGKLSKGTKVYLLASNGKLLSFQDTKGHTWYEIIYKGYPGYILKGNVKNTKYYNTYYNLFSINQSDDNVVVGGITYAMDHGWTTPYLSLVGGAAFYKEGYIENGQDTYYYKDFNVANDQSKWWHEYAGAINSPAASALLLSYAYGSDYNAKLHFRIPVYRASGLSAPKLVSVQNKAKGVEVTWNKVSGATKYRVYRKAAGAADWTKVADVTGSPYLDTGVKGGTSYSYTVRSYKDGTAGKYNKTGLSIYYLAPPEGVGVKAVTGGMQLSWKSTKGAVKYKIFRKPDGGTWKAVTKVTGTSWTDTGVAEGTQYSYRIKAIASTGNASGYSSIVTGLSKPAKPVLVSAKNAAGGIKVQWKTVKSATKYRVYRKVAGDSKWTKLADTKDLVYLDKTVKNGVKYVYTVKAYNASGAGKIDKTGVKRLYVKAPVLQTVKQSGSSVKLSWKKTKGAVKYLVYRKAAGGKWKVIRTIKKKTTVKDQTAQKGVLYSYAVKAVAAGGKASARGSAVQITIN